MWRSRDPLDRTNPRRWTPPERNEPNSDPILLDGTNPTVGQSTAAEQTQRPPIPARQHEPNPAQHSLPTHPRDQTNAPQTAERTHSRPIARCGTNPASTTPRPTDRIQPPPLRRTERTQRRPRSAGRDELTDRPRFPSGMMWPRSARFLTRPQTQRGHSCPRRSPIPDLCPYPSCPKSSRMSSVVDQ